MIIAFLQSNTLRKYVVSCYIETLYELSETGFRKNLIYIEKWQ